MKKLLCMVLIFAVCSFVACKKADEKSAAQGKQGKQQASRQAQKQKRQKKGKGGPRAQTLQIFQEEKMIVAIPRQDFTTLGTTPIQVKGKEEKGILLSDLLKKHNVTGKNVVLRGPNRVSSITWEEATTNQIYIYPVKNRLQIFHESKALEDAEIPAVLVRIDVADKPVASTNGKKAAKKPAT
jgi:hypothetical protein